MCNMHHMHDMKALLSGRGPEELGTKHHIRTGKGMDPYPVLKQIRPYATRGGPHPLDSKADFLNGSIRG